MDILLIIMSIGYMAGVIYLSMGGMDRVLTGIFGEPPCEDEN